MACVEEEAAAVAALRSLGALCIGKTQMHVSVLHEFETGLYTFHAAGARLSGTSLPWDL